MNFFIKISKASSIQIISIHKSNQEVHVNFLACRLKRQAQDVLRQLTLFFFRWLFTFWTNFAIWFNWIYIKFEKKLKIPTLSKKLSFFRVELKKRKKSPQEEKSELTQYILSLPFKGGKLKISLGLYFKMDQNKGVTKSTSIG